MKRIVLFGIVAISFLNACTQGGKSQRPSPPAKASEITNSSVTITIEYSQPGVKGRTIGKDLEPMPGRVWRTGANEATVFEINKDVKIEGQLLPAGKYGLFSIDNGDEWTMIFNKTWDQLGTEWYKQEDDALRVNVKEGKAPKFAERMTFTIDKNGTVSLLWAYIKVDFNVQ